MKRLEVIPHDSGRELTVFEKPFVTDPDPKTAMVAIDTVSNFLEKGSLRVADSCLVVKEIPDLFSNLYIIHKLLEIQTLKCIL